MKNLKHMPNILAGHFADEENVMRELHDKIDRVLDGAWWFAVPALVAYFIWRIMG